MQAYVSVSFSRRQFLQQELKAICAVLSQHAIKPFVFADNYRYEKNQEKEMMERTFADIDKSDILIAETTDKAIGIGVEVGYAKAKEKPLIYMRKSSGEHSTTVSGASDHQIVYDDVDDLALQLKEVLKIILTSRA